MFQALLNPMHVKWNMTISEWYSGLGMQLEITFFHYTQNLQSGIRMALHIQ